MGKSGAVLSFPSKLVKVLGDHPTAAVFSQIAYWHKGRLRVQRKGQMWLAKSRAELCEECGITLDQYKRVVPKLKAMGLLLSERGLFQNRVTPMFRLTPLGYQVMAGDYAGLSANPLEAEATNQLESVGTNPLGSDAANLSTEITAESTAESKDSALTAQSVAEFTEVQKIMAGAKEVLQNMKSKAPEVKVGLPILWKRLMTGVYDLPFVKELPQKEQAQLRAFGKAVAGTMSPYEALSYAVHNWTVFTWKVRTDKGYSVVPEKPVIGFLLAHHDTLLQLIAETKTTQKSVPKTVDVSPQKGFDKQVSKADTPAKISEEQKQADLQYFAELAKGKG